MTVEELAQIITKYKGLSDRYEPIDEEKSHVYSRFTEFFKRLPSARWFIRI